MPTRSELSQRGRGGALDRRPDPLRRRPEHRPAVGGGASYAGYNQALADLAKHRDNLRVVDWAGLVTRNRGWLAGDGVARERDRLRARGEADRETGRALLMGETLKLTADRVGDDRRVGGGPA